MVCRSGGAAARLGAALLGAALLAGCGGAATRASPAPTSPPGDAQPSASLPAPPAATVSGDGSDWPLACTSVSLAGNSGFASAGPNSPVTLDEIGTAVGFKVTGSMPDTQSALAFHGYEGCDYSFDTPAGGASLRVYLVVGTNPNDGKSAAEDLAATESTKIPREEHSCTGDCATALKPLPGVGDTAFTTTRVGAEVLVALHGRVYVELLGDLKDERLARLAQLIFGKVQ